MCLRQSFIADLTSDPPRLVSHREREEDQGWETHTTRDGTGSTNGRQGPRRSAIERTRDNGSESSVSHRESRPRSLRFLNSFRSGRSSPSRYSPLVPPLPLLSLLAPLSLQYLKPHGLSLASRTSAGGGRRKTQNRWSRSTYHHYVGLPAFGHRGRSSSLRWNETSRLRSTSFPSIISSHFDRLHLLRSDLRWSLGADLHSLGPDDGLLSLTYDELSDPVSLPFLSLYVCHFTRGTLEDDSRPFVVLE